MPLRDIMKSSCGEEDFERLYSSVGWSSRLAIERPEFESWHCRKRLFFHKKIFNSLKIITYTVWLKNPETDEYHGKTEF